MRVSRSQFVVDVESDISDRELTFFRSQLTMKEHLEKQISEFLFQMFVARAGFHIEMVDGLKHFVGLFKKMTTGSGLPAGPAGLLGAAEGLSFLSILAGVGVLALLVGQLNCVPNAFPLLDYSDKVNVCD